MLDSSTLLAFAIAGTVGVLVYVLVKRLRKRGKETPHEHRKLTAPRPRTD